MTCPPGFKFDELVKVCVASTLEEPQPATEPPSVLRTSAKTPSLHASEVSPSVWISVVVVANGSILALLLWFLIYRMQRRYARTPGSCDQSDFYAPAVREAEISPGVQQPGRRHSLEVEIEGPPSSCPHLNGGPKGLLKQEVPTWRYASECSAGGVASVHMCNGRKDHGIPLPATELGDAALVTAKTVQYAD